MNLPQVERFSLGDHCKRSSSVSYFIAEIAVNWQMQVVDATLVCGWDINKFKEDIMKKLALVAFAVVTLLAGTPLVSTANAAYSFPTNGYAQGGNQ